MRTSGGAGVSHRRLRDATPGPLHSLTTFLLTLLLLCSLIAAESPSPPSQQPHEWSPHVTVSTDGIATSRGTGRRRSDGLSITRSIPVETGIAPDAAVDDQAIKFSPARVELGRMETCSPQRYYVGVENRGRVSVRLDGADFTHKGFSLATDVRGIRLDPGDKFNVQFVFLPSQVEPNGVDAHLRVLTTSGLFALPISSPEVVMNRYGVSAIKASIPAGVRFGQSLQFVNPLDYTIRITEIYALDSFVHLELLNGSNWIGPRWPREEDETDIDFEIPGKYEKQFDYTRRADRGAWDMPAGTTNPLIKVSLKTSTPGVYFTYIHIAAGERRLLLVPVCLTVMKPGIHIEPKELDLGVLTDLHENEHREVHFTLYNAGVNPIEILELKVLKSNLVVSAQLWGGSAVIPPRTQVLDALTVQIRVDRETPGGTCFASLLLKTNASSSELGQRKLNLYGRVVHGSMAFQLNETSVGVVMPLENVFYDGVNNTDKEQSVETSTTKLVSIIGENSSMGIMAGTSAFRTVRLWNQFDCPVELQRVWVESTLSSQDEPKEVSVYRFKQGVVPAGSAWPKISLQISPTVQSKTFSARYYSLMVETNVSLHRIQLHVYHGFLSVNSSRGLQNYSVSGYYSASLIREQNSSQACLVVPRGGLVTTASPRIDGGRTAGTQSVQICRSLLFDLEKVASHRSRTEVVLMMNKNPVPISLKITSVYESDIVDISIKADISLMSLNGSLGFGTTSSWSNVLQRNSTNNNTNVVSAGNQFVLQPGYQVVFHVKVQAHDTLGELIVPVMSVKTPMEVLHLHTRLQSVRGTVEPVTPDIILPSMFPGRTKVVHLQYRNTFEHSVTPLMATISSSNLKLLSMRDAMAPKQVESVLDLLFSPAADSKCSSALFLADCLISQQVPMTDQTCEHLSDYGELVDEHDLAALRRRDEFWSRRQGTERQLTIEAQVHLQTDIVEDVAEVTIKALLERPLVTASTVASLERDDNSSNIFARKEFELTELLDHSHVFVNVRNPSNISIQMELAIAETDQALFYSCQEELSAKKEAPDTTNDGVENHYEDISSSCLAEWRSAAGDAVALRQDKQVGIDVSPFYFQSNIVHVPAGGEAQLGPIYYLPSKVQEVATTVFVRNDLSHIEPVSLLACSGKGTLDVSVDMPDISVESAKVLYIARDNIDTTANTVDNGEVLNYDGTLSFALTKHDRLTDYTQGAEILVSNTGPFGLIINSLAVKRSSDASWTVPASDTRTGEFLVTLEELRQEDGKNGQMMLSAGETTRIHVSFCASCLATTVTSWLIIDTSDSIKRIRLQGTITTDAAFSCLHSRMAPPLRYAFHYAWMIAAAVTVIFMLYTIFSVLHDVWISEIKHKVQIPNHAVGTGDPSSDLAVLENHGDLIPNIEAPHTLESIHHILADMEKVAFTPSARVATPAVSRLLEQRHKGLCSSVQGNASVHFNEDEEVRRAEREHSTTEIGNGPIALLSREPERSLAPDAEKELNVQVTHKEDAKEAVNADTSLSLKKTLLSAPGGAILEGNDDNDSSPDENSSESPEASPRHPTIATEKSNTNLSELSFGFTGDRSKPALGFDRPSRTTPSQKTEDPFDAFTSLSERWRAQDWQDESSRNFLDTIDDWNGTLSLNTLGQSLLTPGDQRNENVRSGNNRSESSSFLGTGSRFFLDEFSAFPAPAPPSLSTPKPSTKKAPPGFTPADAKPLEARAAFERLRSSGSATPAIATADDNSQFASKLPLFGPALPPKSDDRVTLGGVGRIGSGRSKVLRGLDVSVMK